MFYSFLRNCARLFYIIVYHIHVIGGENIPKEKGGYIIASNHVSNNDPPVVGITFKGKYTFMAKEELFRDKPDIFVAYFQARRVSGKAGREG